MSRMMQRPALECQGNARELICVQGLGFVGAAMSTAVASAKRQDGTPAFDVVGVDLPSAEGRRRAAALARGDFPFATEDGALREATRAAHRVGNLSADTDNAVLAQADIVICDVHLDVKEVDGSPAADFTSFQAAIRTLGERMKPGALLIVETTVPPGTTEKVVIPELTAALQRRDLAHDAIMVAHSYERVMPGPNYLDSIVNQARVYSGYDDKAADACAAFLGKVVNVRQFPLTRLSSPTASETAKILENSYRAVTIALMDEWTRFADAVGIDLFPVLEAIRHRPTHSNMRQPGFGVGGYCLTKDPLFAQAALRQLYDRADLEFPFCTRAVRVNSSMPLGTLALLERRLGGLAGKRILLLGVAYRSDVADTRFSPSELFVHESQQRGAIVVCHDPMVRHWPEMKLDVPGDLPSATNFDAVVLAVGHSAYRDLDWRDWLGQPAPLFCDANGVLPRATLDMLINTNVPVVAIGRGDI